MTAALNNEGEPSSPLSAACAAPYVARVVLVTSLGQDSICPTVTLHEISEGLPGQEGTGVFQSFQNKGNSFGGRSQNFKNMEVPLLKGTVIQGMQQDLTRISLPSPHTNHLAQTTYGLN